MSNVNLGIGLSDKSRQVETDLLFLEQEEFSPYVGKLTKAGMAVAVIGWIFPEKGIETQNRCGGEDGRFEITIYAYLYQQDLSYNAYLSYGVLGDRRIEELDYVEIIRCSLKEQVDFSYPNEGIVSAEFVGNAYDMNGDIISSPSYTSDNRSMYFSKKVYASIKVRYSVKRHVYNAIITSRAQLEQDITTEENKYQSTAYAVWSGGIDWIETKTPYGFEEFDGDCGNGTIVIINPPDPDPDDPPKVSPENTETHIDYCTQVES